MLHPIQVKVSSNSPLLMHNPQLADPANKWARAMKAITAKGKKKTDADLAELSELEYKGGLYVDENGHPCIPGHVIEGCFVAASRKLRLGTDSKIGMFCDGNWPLVFDGPRTIDGLIKDERFRDFRSVVVGQARVMRTRPKFPIWALNFTIHFDDESLSPGQVSQILDIMGSQCGIGDYTPKFGRFSVDKVVGLPQKELMSA